MNFWGRNFILESSGFIVVLLLWYGAYFLSITSTLIIPSLGDVFLKLLMFFIDKQFFLNLGATIVRIVVSFLMAALLGVSLGLLLGFYPPLNKATERLVDFIRSIPGIALFPLFILFFGVSEVSRIAVTVTTAGLIILINTKYGVLYSSKMRRNFYKLYSLSTKTMFFKVLLPEASPFIFTGFRIAISIAVIVVIVTEMLLGTQYGLGQMLVISQIQFETDTMYAVIIMLGLIGSVVNLIFNKIERKIFHWRSEE